MMGTRGETCNCNALQVILHFHAEGFEESVTRVCPLDPNLFEAGQMARRRLPAQSLQTKSVLSQQLQTDCSSGSNRSWNLQIVMNERSGLDFQHQQPVYATHQWLSEVLCTHHSTA